MMLIKYDTSLQLPDSIKNGYVKLFVLLCISFGLHSRSLYTTPSTKPTTITYYLNIEDFAETFIQIPTSNVSESSLTLASSYLAGRAPVYNVNDIAVGTCSASFLSIQTQDGIYTDISNYLSTDDGLIVTWFTPTTLINLELDSVINGMVTECTVVVTTKVGVAPLFGQTFDLIVSSDSEKIYFQFTRIGMIF